MVPRQAQGFQGGHDPAFLPEPGDNQKLFHGRFHGLDFAKEQIRPNSGIKHLGMTDSKPGLFGFGLERLAAKIEPIKGKGADGIRLDIVLRFRRAKNRRHDHTLSSSVWAPPRPVYPAARPVPGNDARGR